MIQMNTGLWRRLTAITLLVSLVALATSGLMMFVIEKPSFTIAMHPVHKPFGLLMIVSACSHLWLNRAAIGKHLKQRSGLYTLGVLTMLLIGAYGAAVQMDRTTPLAQQLDALAHQFEESR
jgi:hypothetical protein